MSMNSTTRNLGSWLNFPSWYYNYVNIVMVCGSILSWLAYFSLIANITCFVVFLSLRKWKSPAKIFYLAIIVTNLLLVLFVDIPQIHLYLMLERFLSTFGWFIPMLIQAKSWMRKKFLNDWICAGGSWLTDLLTAAYFWVPALFALHRTLVILYPFKANQIQKIFGYRSLIAMSAIFALSCIPVLVYTKKGWYTCSTFSRPNNNRILVIYWIVNYFVVSHLLPIVILVVCNTVIIVKIRLANRKRNSLVKQKTITIEKSTKVLIVLSFLYVLLMCPYVLVSIYVYALGFNKLSMLQYSVIYMFTSYINVTFPLILRFVETFVYPILIPEFRAQLLCCIKK